MLALLLSLVSAQSLSSQQIFPFDLVHWNQEIESVKAVLDSKDVEYYGIQTSCATYDIVAYQENPIGKRDTITYSFYISNYKIRVDNKQYPRVSGLYTISVKIHNESVNLESGSDKELVSRYTQILGSLKTCRPNDDVTGYYGCLEKESTTWSIYTKIGEQINIRVPTKYDARFADTKISFRQAVNFPNLETAKLICEDSQTAGTYEERRFAKD